MENASATLDTEETVARTVFCAATIAMAMDAVTMPNATAQLDTLARLARRRKVALISALGTVAASWITVCVKLVLVERTAVWKTESFRLHAKAIAPATVNADSANAFAFPLSKAKIAAFQSITSAPAPQPKPNVQEMAYASTTNASACLDLPVTTVVKFRNARRIAAATAFARTACATAVPLFVGLTAIPPMHVRMGAANVAFA